MKQRCMPKALVRLFFALLLCGAVIPGIVSAAAYEIEIDVSPNVLNIGSNSVIVTVHTDIAFGEVSFSTVTLNNVAIDSWKADDRGNFVAKFLSDEVKALVGLAIGEDNTLVLTGQDIDGDSFSGAQDILVIHVLPKGK